AAAVQILAYELFQACETARDIDPSPRGQAAAWEQIEGLHAQLEKTLIDIGFLDPGQPRFLMRRLRRLCARAGLEKEEVAILRGILGAVDKKRSNNSR
ncbi:MAG: RNA methyltransferase, partial [Burkholderiales bacterium]